MPSTVCHLRTDAPQRIGPDATQICATRGTHKQTSTHTAVHSTHRPPSLLDTGRARRSTLISTVGISSNARMVTAAEAASTTTTATAGDPDRGVLDVSQIGVNLGTRAPRRRTRQVRPSSVIVTHPPADRTLLCSSRIGLLVCATPSTRVCGRPGDSPTPVGRPAPDARAVHVRWRQGGGTILESSPASSHRGERAASAA